MICTISEGAGHGGRTLMAATSSESDDFDGFAEAEPPGVISEEDDFADFAAPEAPTFQAVEQPIGISDSVGDVDENDEDFAAFCEVAPEAKGHTTASGATVSDPSSDSSSSKPPILEAPQSAVLVAAATMANVEDLAASTVLSDSVTHEENAAVAPDPNEGASMTEDSASPFASTAAEGDYAPPVNLPLPAISASFVDSAHAASALTASVLTPPSDNESDSDRNFAAFSSSAAPEPAHGLTEAVECVPLCVTAEPTETPATAETQTATADDFAAFSSPSLAASGSISDAASAAPAAVPPSEPDIAETVAHSDADFALFSSPLGIVDSADDDWSGVVMASPSILSPAPPADTEVLLFYEVEDDDGMGDAEQLSVVMLASSGTGIKEATLKPLQQSVVQVDASPRAWRLTASVPTVAGWPGDIVKLSDVAASLHVSAVLAPPSPSSPLPSSSVVYPAEPAALLPPACDDVHAAWRPEVPLVAKPASTVAASPPGSALAASLQRRQRQWAVRIAAAEAAAAAATVAITPAVAATAMEQPASKPAAAVAHDAAVVSSAPDAATTPPSMSDASIAHASLDAFLHKDAAPDSASAPLAECDDDGAAEARAAATRIVDSFAQALPNLAPFAAS